MKKIILVLLLTFPSMALAYCSTPEAIEYQWGSVADTANGSITAWRHLTEPQPSSGQVEAVRVGDCSKEKARADKKSALWDEAERRVHVYMPGINLISTYHLWSSIDNKTPDAAMLAAMSYYAPWKDARDTLDNFTGIASINAFDAMTTLP